MSGWVRFLAARLAASLGLLFVFLTVMFWMTVALILGDFATVYRLTMRAEEVDRIRAVMGLDQPWWVQLGHWLSGLAHGSLGTSFSGADVGSVVASVLPFTLLLLVGGVGGAFVVGALIGRAAGWGRSQRWDGVLVGMSTLSTLFPPWLAFLLAFGVVGVLGFGPFTRLRQLDRGLWRGSPVSPAMVAWEILLSLAAALAVWVLGRILIRRFSDGVRSRQVADALLTVAVVSGALALAGDLAGSRRLADVIGLMVLPTVAVMLVNVSDTALLVATVARSYRPAPFVFAARAKGLDERRIAHRHVGRMALIPVISRFVAGFPLVLGGLVIIEAAFRTNGDDYSVAFPGLSATIFGALGRSDIPLALGALLVVGVITLTVRLLLDVVHAALDPRYRDGTRAL